jgi:hypothetical protein
MLSIFFGWEAFIPLQIVGFLVLSFGAFTFGGVINLEYILPSFYPIEPPSSDAEEPLLRRCFVHELIGVGT